MYWFQGMVILAANQVWWTWEVEDTFMKVKKGDKMGLKNYSKKLHSQIGEVVVKVCNVHCNHCIVSTNLIRPTTCTFADIHIDDVINTV